MPGMQTEVMVMVAASNGKFLGADIGNALVTITDESTGEILASGLTHGSSGDTNAMMLASTTRGTPLPMDQKPAMFKASLTLDRPRLLSFTAQGPMAGLQSQQKATVTQWVIPGKHLTRGNGILLTLSGLLVQVLSPATHYNFAKPQPVVFTANVAMMCGCPINNMPPGTIPLWRPENFHVGAQIWCDGACVADVPMTFTGTTGQFTGQWDCQTVGFYTAVIYALENNSGNAGCGTVAFFLTS